MEAAREGKVGLADRLGVVIAILLLLVSLSLPSIPIGAAHHPALSAVDAASTVIAPAKATLVKSTGEENRPRFVTLGAAASPRRPVPGLVWQATIPGQPLFRLNFAAHHQEARGPPPLPIL